MRPCRISRVIHAALLIAAFSTSHSAKAAVSVLRRSARLICLALCLLSNFTMLPAFGVSFSIESDAGDAALLYIPSLGQLDAFPEITDTRVGNAGSAPNRSNVNAVYLFELPDISGGSLMDAELRFPYIDAENGFNQSDLDVWGLGYVASPTADANWLYVGDNDVAAGINITSRQKIQDDVVGALPDPGGVVVVAETDSTGNTNLVTFIQSLYSQGAQAGDYAIIRLNDDRANPDPNFGGTGGYRVGFSEYGGPVPQLGLFDATVIDWINPNGGGYAFPSNWSPGNVPNNAPSAESARFNVAAVYNVTFASGSSTTATDLIVSEGTVTLENAAVATAVATYNLTDQAIVDGGTLVVADSASSFDVDVNVAGEVTINDASSLVLNGGTFTAAGALTMTSGSTLTIDGGNLNANAGLDNSAAGMLDHRDGTLTITGGAFQPNAAGPTDSYTIEAPTAADTPHLVIGAGATATIVPVVRVGALRHGELTITDGGSLFSSLGRVEAQLGTSVATVHGEDSTWTISGDLLVGFQFDGTFHITGGGSVSNVRGGLGDLGGFGVMTVDGTDTNGTPSTWTNSSSMEVNGTLSVTNGSMVSNTDGSIGDGPNQEGMVTVDGTDSSGNPSTWTNTSVLDVGDFGTGTLIITGGGSVSNTTGTIADRQGSMGMVTVDGANSTWTNTAALIVGNAEVGTLTITNNGLVTVGTTTTIGSQGAVDLDGGRFEFGEMSFADFDVINKVSGSMAGDVVHNEFTDVGTLSQFQNGAIVMAEVSVKNTGTLYGDGTLQTGLNNDIGGEVEVATGERMRFEGTSNSNGGQVTLSGGHIHFTQEFTNNNGGLVIGNGTFRSDGGTTNDGDMAFSATANVIGDVTNNANGTIISSGGTTTFFDDVANNGEIRTSQNSFTVYYGSYSGSGDTGGGTVIMEGDLKPGSSPGTMAFGGDLSFGPDAGLEIELGGLIAGADFDQVAVAEEVTLNGTLDVALINGFSPSADDSFEIISATGGVNGTFLTTAEMLPTLSGDLEWDILYNSNSVVLNVVAPGLPGDYNNDGVVNAADYVLWRNHQGSGTSLPNDNTPGVGQDDYDRWVDNFGATVASGADVGSSVPEPSTALLAGLLAAAGLIARRRRHF